MVVVDDVVAIDVDDELNVVGLSPTNTIPMPRTAAIVTMTVILIAPISRSLLEPLK